MAPRPARKSVGSAAAPPPAIDNLRFRWTARSLDHEFVGEWDWHLQGKEASDLLDVLENMSELTWREVKSQKTNSKRHTRQLHHAQPVESICVDAQRRLEELELELIDVFRLRHGNMLRIWGFIQDAVFHILWFDRNHKVCPADTN